MYLENTVLNERSQTPKSTYVLYTYICMIFERLTISKREGKPRERELSCILVKVVVSLLHSFTETYWTIHLGQFYHT